MIGYERFLAEEQPRHRAEGRHVGIGIVNYVEGTGIGPYEGARVTVEPSGLVRVATGVGTQGQGHFTAFAQIVADALGVEVGDVRVVTGDTRQFHWGTGTFASRGAVVAGTACQAAALAVRDKILDAAARALDAPRDRLELAGGQVRVIGDPGPGVALGELASQANPLRGAVTAGVEPGLEATAYFGPDRGSTANGVHAMIVEVDPDTAMVRIKRYVVVHDCGHLINPMIVEGQIQGGVAHGIGNAFYEQLVFDAQGQLTTASFMDYLLPLATDVPDVEMAHRETPSPGNPAGLKGVGEAGCIATGALFAQAVEDALGGAVEILEIPLSPNRLFELMQAGRRDVVKPAPFAITGPTRSRKPSTLLARHGGEAKPLAGGQSLVPAMNFRLAQPSVLVDLNRIGALAGIARRRRRPAHRRHDPPPGARAESAGGAAGAAGRRDDAVCRPPADPHPRHPGRQPGARRSGGRTAGGDAGAGRHHRREKPGRAPGRFRRPSSSSASSPPASRPASSSST